MSGILYIVATPIGNLSDITLRALSVLGSVDYIACEDTRHIKKLLTHHNIVKPLLACHAHNERSSAEGIIKLLEAGKSIAYCSDAGTPGMSDPGGRLADSVRRTGCTIEPVPGVSAFTALMSVSGCYDGFTVFVGFLPPKGNKRLRKLEELFNSGYNFVVYEAPHRMAKFLEECVTLDAGRSLFIGREMTKIHEEFWKGSAEELRNCLTDKKMLGEFAILVASGEKR
jgi:16S rRNA (cytidine1402-2'-O)-methyltransferase